MRFAAMVIAGSLVAAACVGEVEDGAEDPNAQIMAAALTQLVTVDHTFGQGPPPFTEYLIQTSTDPSAGDHEGGGPARPLTTAEQEAVEEAIADIGPVRWIDDPDEFRTPDLMPTVEGAVILGVGEPVIDGNSGEVPVSLWCSGLCGTWLTYTLEFSDGEWTVTGTTGPIAMS